MTNLADTSVPSWVFGSPQRAEDVGGASYLLVGVGQAAEVIVAQWNRELAGYPIEVIVRPDATVAGAALREVLSHASVGLRVRFAGPTGACLHLRAVALSAGMEDDEMAATPTEAGPIEVYCTHCGGTVTVSAGIGDIVTCAACDLNLMVYHHVSRRSGRFMGYMSDAEAAIP